MNDVKLLGKLKEAPELKASKTGSEYCKITLIIRMRTAKDTYENIPYDNIFVFGKTAIQFAKFGRKNMDCIVQGSLIPNKRTETNRFPGFGVKVFTATLLGVDMTKPNDITQPIPNVETTDDEDENLPF